MNKVKVPVKVLPNGEGLELPFYATLGSAGMDLLSAIDNDIVLKSGGRVLVPTGLQFGLPQGYEVQIRPRSGLAIKNGITLVNSPGTIDSDYRGEVGIIMINHGKEDFVITRGMRIAQAVLCPVWQICWDKVEELDETYRGSDGFGSTGLNSN